MTDKAQVPQSNTLLCPIHRGLWSVVLKATSSRSVNGTELCSFSVHWPETGGDLHHSLFLLRSMSHQNKHVYYSRFNENNRKEQT